MGIIQNGYNQKYNLPESDFNVDCYNAWLDIHEKRRLQSPQKELKYKPGFSFVIPVYNTASEQLSEAIDSVLNQTYDNFELILIDDNSTWESVREVLKSYEDNPHVHVIYRKENGNISVATNDGIEMSSCEFTVFMDCDDLIQPDSLYLIAEKLNENPKLDFIYSDEDHCIEDGSLRYGPHFKPDWSPDLFWSEIFTTHLSVFRTSIVKEIGGLRTEYNGSQDYDMTLRFLEKTTNEKICHIPEILYTWRARKESTSYSLDSKPYAVAANYAAKEEALKRRNIKAHIEEIPIINQAIVVFEPEDNPKVSIIIPMKNDTRLFEGCIRKIRELTTYPNYEIIVVDNSTGFAQKSQNKKEAKALKVKYVRCGSDFNIARLYNHGAKKSEGEYLLFMHDSVEITQPDWLDRMVGQAMQPCTGAVGVKCYYPGTEIIRYEGMSLIDGEIKNNYQNMNNVTVPGYGKVVHNIVAVSGVCMMLKKETFYKAGCFDESFGYLYSDVDICCSLYEKGYFNVMRNDVIVYYGWPDMTESYVDDADRFKDLYKDIPMLYSKHPDRKKHDPFININLNSYQNEYNLKELIKPVKCITPKSEDFQCCEGIFAANVEDNLWTSSHFKVKIKDETIAEKGIMVKLYLPLDLYEKAHPDIQPKLYLFVNRKYQEEAIVDREDMKIHLKPERTKDDIYEVELFCNLGFVPSLINDTGDIRFLTSLIIYIGSAGQDEVL